MKEVVKFIDWGCDLERPFIVFIAFVTIMFFAVLNIGIAILAACLYVKGV